MAGIRLARQNTAADNSLPLGKDIYYILLYGKARELPNEADPEGAVEKIPIGLH
jgi:hypothetical protein